MKRIVVLIVLAATLHGCALAPTQTTKADTQTVPVPPPASAPMRDWADRDVLMPKITAIIVTAIGAFILLSYINRDKGDSGYNSSKPQDPCPANDPQRPSWCP